MLEKTKNLFRQIIILVNIAVILLYLLVCLVPFIDTGKYWYIAFLGLGFPLLFFALLALIIFHALARSKWFWISLIAMLLGTQQILALFAFHLPSKFTSEKEINTLRILHWNVEGWDDFFYKEQNHQETDLPRMMEFLKKRNADILCFEEYSDKKNLKDSNSIASTIVRMGYPYYVFAETEEDAKYNPRGVIIFSKYPIIHSDIFNYEPNSMAEHLIYADVKCGEKVFRIFTTHLQSVRFQRKDYESLMRLRHARDPGYHDSKTIVSKLKTGYKHRYLQAITVKEKMAESPYPVVLTGDFNDVPNSNTYFTIKGNLQDAFLKKGFFIGRTFRYISPTLRIDYIFTDKYFRVNQFQIIHVSYSDHYPLETDLQY